MPDDKKGAPPVAEVGRSLSQLVAGPLPRAWSELLDRLARQYPLAERSASWLCIAWPPPAPDQTIQVSCFTTHGEVRLVVTADMCRAGEVSERRALELGAKLLIGGVVIQNGILGLRHVFNGASFTERQLHDVIQSLRANAIRFRAHLRGPGASGALFDNFVP